MDGTFPIEGVLLDNILRKNGIAENKALNISIERNELLEERNALRETLGLALVYILQHTDKHNEHFKLLKRIEELIGPK